MGSSRYRRPRPACSLAPEILAALAVSALYAATLRFGFVFDDHSLIGPDGPLWVGGAAIPYRPLRHASFWLDHYVGGGQAWAYHLGNVALHAVASVLVVRLCRRAGASSAVALTCASAFALHPLGVEAVAYVSGRRDLLATVLGLAAIAAWTSPQGWSALAICFALLAVASKEAALLVIPQLFAASLCGLGPPVGRALAPLVSAGIAAFALPIAYGARGPLAPTGSLASNLALAGDMAAHYGRNLIAPVALSVDYPALRCEGADCAALLSIGAEAAGMLLIGATVLCVVLLAVYGAGSRPAREPGGRSRRMAGDWLLFAAVWVMSWVIALSFVIGAHEPGADRHAYPLLAALAVLVSAAAARGRAIVRAVSAALLVLWLLWVVPVARERMWIWSDDLTLWRHEARAGNASARVHHNLAAELSRQHRYAGARRELRAALVADAGYWPSELGLAGIDCLKGRTLSAAGHLAEASRLGAPDEQTAVVFSSCEQRAAAQ